MNDDTVAGIWNTAINSALAQYKNGYGAIAQLKMKYSHSIEGKVNGKSADQGDAGGFDGFGSECG